MTLDELHAGALDDRIAKCWRDKDGFFVISSGRWREFGWACGRLGFTYQYTQYLIVRITWGLKRHG